MRIQAAKKPTAGQPEKKTVATATDEPRKRPREGEEERRLNDLVNTDVLEGFLAYRQRRSKPYVRPRTFL